MIAEDNRMTEDREDWKRVAMTSKCLSGLVKMGVVWLEAAKEHLQSCSDMQTLL